MTRLRTRKLIGHTLKELKAVFAFLHSESIAPQLTQRQYPNIKNQQMSAGSLFLRNFSRGRR